MGALLYDHYELTMKILGSNMIVSQELRVLNKLLKDSF